MGRAHSCIQSSAKGVKEGLSAFVGRSPELSPDKLLDCPFNINVCKLTSGSGRW
jgi:hypothetical protein